MLLTIVLVAGTWLLLAAWSGAAHADPRKPDRSTADQVEQPPLTDPLLLPPVDPVPADASREGGPRERSTKDAASSPALPPAPDSGVTPEPIPPDGSVVEESAVIPDEDSGARVPDDDPRPSEPDPTAPTVEAQPVDPSAAAVETAPLVVDPALVDPALEDPALVDPALVDPALVDPALVDPALVDPALVDPALVDPALVDPALVDPALVDPAAANTPPVEGVVTHARCGGPELGLVAAPDVSGASVCDDGFDGRDPARNRSAVTGTSTPAPTSAEASSPPAGMASPGGAPGGPASPPAPVPLPAPLSTPAPVGPVGPVGPAGSSAAASSGSSCYGSGHPDRADSIDAVLEARVTTSLAQAAARPTSGFAGAVVGGADDPGVRPG